MVGANLFENELPEYLQEELSLAAELGIIPLQIGEPGFDEAIAEGRVKWVVNSAGSLLFIPKFVGKVELAHTVRTYAVEPGSEPKLRLIRAQLRKS